MPCVKIVVKEPAKFYVTNLRVEPSEPTTADQIKVFARVGNSGDVDGYATIQLKVDGNVVKEDKVYVIAGYYQDIAYTIDKLSAGEHQICIDVV